MAKKRHYRGKDKRHWFDENGKIKSQYYALLSNYQMTKLFANEETKKIELNNLVNFFNQYKIPTEPFKLNSYITIIDCRKSITVNINTLKANKNLITFSNSLDTLYLLKEYFIKNCIKQ